MTQVKDSWKEKGYVDEPIPAGLDLKAEIRRMCKEKNAIILAHYYTEGVLQDIADFVGDSLGLAQQAAKTDADIIVMCGVHFMGETNKILCPNKMVLVPDLNATCSLAESCPADEFKKFVEAHPGYQVVSYVNTTAAVKALTDVVVTSSNAKRSSRPSRKTRNSSSALTITWVITSTLRRDATCCSGMVVVTFTNVSRLRSS